MRQPQGDTAAPGMLCKLKRALYGLRSAPRRWQHTLRNILVKHGFHQLKYDTNVYRRDSIMLSVYVDDLALFGPDDTQLAKVIQQLSNDLKVKDFRPINRYLGMDISRDKVGRVHLSHQAKIEGLASRLHLDGCRTATVPISDDNLLDSDDGAPLSPKDHVVYRSAVGSLLHIASFTRPDITYAVHRLARKLAAPTSLHQSALYQVIR